MASSNFSATTYALQKSVGGNLRFLSTFAHLAGRDLSPTASLFLLLVNPTSSYEALSSWGFLSIAIFWLWMLASRLGMLAVVGLVASAPWWLTILPDDTPSRLAAAYKVTSRALVGELQFETLLSQQIAKIDGLSASLQTSQAEIKALEVRVHQAEQRPDAPHQLATQLKDAQIKMKSMTVKLAKQAEELAETKNELEESKLLAQGASRVPALVKTIEELQGKLETAEELLMERERMLQEEEIQVREKEQELGELVDELEALRDSEYRARAGAAETAKTMVALRKDLTVAKAAVASLAVQLSEKEAAVASISAQLAEQEAETALANREIDELREQVDHGEQALHQIVDKANDKIHRRNAEVSRLWAFVQVRLAEISGLRWELDVSVAEAAQVKKALEVFQPSPSPSVAALGMEEAVRQPPSDLPTIIFQSPSSEWVREEKPRVDKSLLRPPKRNNRTKSKLPQRTGDKSVPAPPTSTSLSSTPPSTSPASPPDLAAGQTSVSSHLTSSSHDRVPPPFLATPPSPSASTPAPLIEDEEPKPTSRPVPEENILPSLAREKSMFTPLNVCAATMRSTPISFPQNENIIPPTSQEHIDSHIFARKADSNAFWAPARSLSVSLRLRRNPLGSISGNAPRRERSRKQNQNQTSSKAVDFTWEEEEGNWTVVSLG